MKLLSFLSKVLLGNFKSLLVYLVSFSFIFLLSSCGDSEVNEKPPVQEDVLSNVYHGPAPQTEDIQRYKTHIWNNISGSDKCGGCHRVDLQAPYFTRYDDVNLAYGDTLALVDFNDIPQSRLVTKVADGHNCWLGSDQACGETMAQWIKLWADEQVSTANTVELKAPVIKDAGTSKSYPELTTLFEQHVYPLVEQNCAGCHSPNASVSIAPFFASNDVDQAYLAAQKVMSIDNPSQSRLAIRLSHEFHNCWGDCQENSAVMLTAIEAMSAEISANTIADDMVISKALKLTDGIVASSGGRFETDVIALYQFKTGSGNTAYDTSGISPAANLTLSGDYSWLGSWGIVLNNGKAQASTATSKKLHDLITATGKFSVEAWLTPNNVVQEGPARIISYSASDTERNFTLGQSQYNYDFMLRTEASSNNGEPALSTPDNDEVLQATLQHVVLTYDATNGRKMYVNGKLIEVSDEQVSPLASWNDSFALILGREATNNHTWQGSVRLLAIFNNVLTQEQIQQNYDIGVGEKFYLLFSISEQINLANTYIVFEVSQFDNYSYLFNSPSLLNLDGASLESSLQISGIKLGLNGKENHQAQAFSNINITLDAGTNLSEPVPLSSLGTIIAVDKGADHDEFFLSFETLGEHSNISVEAEFVATDEVAASSTTSDIGLKTFAEINATMSVLTTVPMETTKVKSIYQLVQRQLPSIDNIETFISAHQMGITQLAIGYCDSAIDGDATNSNWYSAVDLSQSPELAFNQTNRDLFTSALIDQLMPLSLASQPDKSALTDEINALITQLSTCDGSCEAERSKTIAKAACTAILASSATLMQ